MGRAHRATGNRRGRPPRIPFDLGERILKSLERRVNPETGLVKPDWRGMARELGVSRSTIARQMVGLRQCGAVESVYIKVNPKFTVGYYRLKSEKRGDVKLGAAARTSLTGSD